LKPKSFKAAIFLAASVSVFAGKIFACGPDFPNNLLDAGDGAVLQAPVADFARELERMKLVTPMTQAVPLADGQKFYDQSTAVEMSDLAAALKRKKISSELATAIMQAHLAERMKLNVFLSKQAEWKLEQDYYESHGGQSNAPVIVLPVPFDGNPKAAVTNVRPAFPDIAVTPGLPREFADYFEGVIAWQKRAGGYSGHASWEQLLELSPAERHYKSTWAAFMLGKYHVEVLAKTADDELDREVRQSEENEAVKYFEQVRTLATNGFADSLGLATASLGEEARIFLRDNDYERAIELYLEQFAAGDRSALDSLRFSVERAIAESNSTPAQLKPLALNPRTRRVVTAYLISKKPYSDVSEAVGNPDAKQFFDRTTAWLESVESADVKDVESASQLALAAYQAGNMDAAQRWINRAGDEPVAQWLQAKLFMRAGKISGAAKLLAKLSREFPQQPPGTNASASFSQSLYVTIESVWDYSIPIGRQAFGELGVLRLARREYAESLDALLRSGYWLDAAYVAERVLTTEELKNYVDRNWPAITGKDETEIKSDFPSEPPFKPREEIRWLLARRMARETGGDEARNYFPANYSGDYEILNVELQAGRDENLPPAVRAKNLFAAAVMTRTNGMELFGTELEPDWAITGGDYDLGSGFWESRATNVTLAKIYLVGNDEIMRSSSRNVDPEKRFHYRWQAAELAWEAAALLPDNSDETARMLCTGGSWIKRLDPQSADKFYKALVRRCRKTAIGKQADQMRWFPTLDEDGNPIPYNSPLLTVEITPELTNSVATNGVGDVFSTEFPVPGREYVLHYQDDLHIIVRAIERLGQKITV
jgi:hypothetical protein